MILENRAEPNGGNGRNEPPLARTPGADILLLNQLRGKLSNRAMQNVTREEAVETHRM